MIVSTPSFNGKSYLSYPPLSNSSMMLRIAVTIFPTVPNGLILFASFSENNFADYVSIALVNGFVEFSFSLGFGSVTISTSEVLELVVWHTIVAERIGQDGTLVVDDGSPETGSVPSNSFTGLNVHSNLWLGGLQSFVNISSVTNTSVGLTGCISALSINGRAFDLIMDALLGYGIGQCNQTSCDPNPCQNGGTCLDEGVSYVCVCTADFTGPLCGSSTEVCTLGTECANGATCQPSMDGQSFTCLCPLNKGGERCEEGEDIYIYACDCCMQAMISVRDPVSL